MTYDLRDVGERGIPMCFDFGERCTVLCFDLGERPYLFDADERGQVLCAGPEWQMQDGPEWESMKLDDGPGWAMKTSGPDWEGVKMDSGPDWEISLDGGPGWQMYGPPDSWEKILKFGPIETGTALLH
ncbi:hypothetical protein [Brevibacillus sp. MER 51]|uniref:hypothetical protein n=1 Tax=Brevibacillus sp. MER 51 TaxID=2939560 RepID=UPI002040F656|nr:hypothetical protein [Brevibacillus sp. MER 51]MCM3141642.1 hypothetical protein [Brevibacillus sp. MER 51]